MVGNGSAGFEAGLWTTGFGNGVFSVVFSRAAALPGEYVSSMRDPLADPGIRTGATHTGRV
jgi:hypothetical protein